MADVIQAQENESYLKLNILKPQDIRSSIEDAKANLDFDFTDHQFDEETETILRNLNMNPIIDNNDKGVVNENDIVDHDVEDVEMNIKDDSNDNVLNNTNDLPDDDNINEQSKLKIRKNQLSPFAPEFNVISSTSFNPYGGEYGVQTRPAYVPPAQIPSRSQQPTSTTAPSLLSNHKNVSSTHHNGYNARNGLNMPSTNGKQNHNSHELMQNYVNLPQAYKSIKDENNTSDKSNEARSNAQDHLLVGHDQKIHSGISIQQSPNKKYSSTDPYRTNLPQAHDYSIQSGHPSQNPMQLNSLVPNGRQQATALQMPIQGAQPQVANLAYKTTSRNYGPPPSDGIDPKFTNPDEIKHFQKWELLESAKRWLPGEGTFITWGNYRYLIGCPIHMGMNGHIHYCYKYPIPKDNENTKDDKENKNEKLENENAVQIKLPPKVETVAAKIVPNTAAFAREIYILRALQGCENVTHLDEVIESERTLISILELAQADVFNFFVGRVAIRHGWNLDKPAIREHFARMVISNVVQGLDQMHKKNYLHCDLKSLNILLYIYSTGHSQRRGGVYIKGKLTDFGHSTYGQYRTAEKLFSNGMARVGTAGHVAPELFVEGSLCGSKIDIWSLGVVMFSMLVPGRLLFGEYTNLDSLKKAYDRLYKNPFSRDTPSWWSDFERLSPEARDLILWMTRYDDKERPNEEQILQHPWFEIDKQKQSKQGSYRPKLKWVDMLSSSIAQE